MPAILAGETVDQAAVEEAVADQAVPARTLVKTAAVAAWIFPTAEA